MNKKLVVTAGLICGTAALMLAPIFGAPPPGKGKGDKDDQPPPMYSVIELHVLERPLAISNRAASDADLWLAGRGSENSYVAAAFGRIDVNLKVTTGFLPEPRTVIAPEAPGFDLYSGVFNRASVAHDVNDNGVIVGGLDVYDSARDDREFSAHHAAVWFEGESDFYYEDLGMLSGDNFSEASAINNSSLVVGYSALTNPNPDIPAIEAAVLWNLTVEGYGIEDLNNRLPNGSDWTLERAHDISDSELVCGEGILGGARRGFVLNLKTNQIMPVPLPSDGGQRNVALAINEQGDVTGWADSDQFDAGGRAIRMAYFWSFGEVDAVNLGTLTGEDSQGSGLNESGEVVGESDFELDSIATYWSPADTTPVNLETEVPEKPTWHFNWVHDVNDDGWICGHGRKKSRGSYTWAGVILTPTQ